MKTATLLVVDINHNAAVKLTVKASKARVVGKAIKAVEVVKRHDRV